MFFEKNYWFYLATSLQFWVKKKNIFGFSIVNTTKQCFNNQSVCPLNSEIFKSDFACLYRRNCRFYTPVDIAISTGTSKTINYDIFSGVVFFVAKNAELFNFAPRFIICGALCIKYQFKSPFSLRLLWLHACGRHHWIRHIKYYQSALF